MAQSLVNPYPFVVGAGGFRPSEKITHALSYPVEHHPGEGPRQLQSHPSFVRSLEELRRIVFAGAQDVLEDADDIPKAPHRLREVLLPSIVRDKNHEAASRRSSLREAKPWDDTRTRVSLWQWPMEALYQRYHVLIAIDFGASSFYVSERGTVVLDDAPRATEALLEVVRNTLETRRRETACIQRWMETHIEAEKRDFILSHVWDPGIEVSIVLLNAPTPRFCALASPPLDETTLRNPFVAVSDSGFRTELFPPEALSFTEACCGIPNDGSCDPAWTPLLNRCDATLLLQDKSFLSKLKETLDAYEETCKARLIGPWPNKCLFATLEQLACLVPDRPSQCTSAIVLSNADDGDLCDSAALLEGAVRRKNIILSLVILGASRPPLQANTSSLAQFLHRVGGFVAHLDHWLALSAPQLNINWCRRFDGSHCLARHIFVHLDGRFPVCTLHVTNSPPATISHQNNEQHVLYGSANDLESFALLHVSGVVFTLRCVAEARLNEGWSVIMNYNSANPRVAHLCARQRYHLQRGKLNIIYEMNISYPVVYRRVSVSGTKLLVDQFLRMKKEDRAFDPAPLSINSSWLSCLSVVRHQLHTWMRVEEVALQYLRAMDQPQAAKMLGNLTPFSCRTGVSHWWLSYCSVRSIAVFFHWSEGISMLRDPHDAMQYVNVPSIVGVADCLLRSVLAKRHRAVGDASAADFVSEGSVDGFSRYIVQLFPIAEASPSGSDNLLAVGLQLRFCFFCESVDAEQKVLSDIKREVNEGIAGFQRDCTCTGSEWTLVAHVCDSREDGYENILFNSMTLGGPTGISWEHQRGRYRPSSPNVRTAMVRERSEQRLGGCHRLADRMAAISFADGPCSLADTVVLHWTIDITGKGRAFARACFNLLVCRRMHDDSRILYLVDERMAAFHNTRICANQQVVKVFDSLIVSSNVWDGIPGMQLTICRCLHPFHVALIPVCLQELISDISSDVQAVTVLNTFESLSSPIHLPREVVAPESTRRSHMLIQLVPRPELLVPFCSPKHLRRTALRLPSSAWEEVESDLHEATCRVVALLGDKCASVSMSAMNGRLWETLYVPQADAEVTRETQHFILSIMKPSECRCLTMLLMPDAAARPLLPREQSMVVHIFSLDALAVHNGVVCLQGWKGEEASDRSGTRSCSGCLLPEAVEKLLTSFSSLYIAWRLLEHHQSYLEGHVHVDDELVQDILGSRTFQAYLTEVDVSHLLYAQEGAEAHVCVKSINFGYFNGLMTRFLQTINFTAVPAQPVMFMSPECEDMKNSRAEVETEATGCGPPHLPLIIKIALIFVAANGEEKQVWTSAPEKNRLASGCRVGSPGIDPVSPQGGSLILRCIVKTAPQKFMRLSAGGYRPSAEAVWEVLQGLLKELKTAHRGSRSDESPTFSITQTHQLTPGEVRKAVLPTAELPATLRSSIDALLCKLVTLAAQYSLERSLESSAYDALQGIVSGTGFGMGDSPSPSRGDEATDTEKGRSATCTELRGLAQESDCVTERAAVTPGLQELLEYLVAPALLGSSYFQLDTFSVGFASELQRFCNANGTEALVDVLTIHLAQDRVCIVPAAHSCYLFVPNRKHFGSWWLMLHVTTLGDSGAHQIAFLCDKGRDPSVCIYLCQRLKNLIVAKVKRVSQLYLLKQLRGTQHADDELIPRVWGDQFTIEPRTSRDEKGGTAPCSLPEFCCRGSTVLSIPLYYKLQHQCKKILSRISSSSSKLELFSVYNRPQCFVVADDVQRDTFHYIRLIFVKDTAQPPKTTEPSPILSPMDRCPVLLVQLFSATEAAFLERPLCKLKSFCYLLAMQELQGHLNYVRHEFVSTVDLLCLHYTRLDSITVDLPNGDEVSLDTENAQFALLLLVLRLKEKKFKYFKLQEASGPVASNFVEYYGLQRGSTRVTEESSDNGRAMVRELAAMRFVKTVERPADVIVSCTLRVGSGGRLLIDRFLTKVPEQRLSVGRCEDGPLNQIDESIQDAVAHWRFFALSSRFARLSLEQVGPAAEEMVRCCAALPSTDGSMLRVKNFTLDSASPTRLPSLIERLVGIFEPFSPICVECGPDRPPMHISGFPWHWAERLQGDPLVGLITVYLLCGYQVVRASADSEEMLVEPTRSMHVTHPDLPVSVTTVLLQSPLLREHSAGTKLATEPRILLRISLANGITAILFNHLDSDNALRLMGHFVAEAELESDMMHDIMLQRMGFLVPSYLTEAAVARVCHADDFVTTHEQPLKVHPAYCCERIRGERLLPRSLGDVEPLVSVLEGLLNRGLLFEETVRFSDVVMALYNECPGLSLEECRAEAQCLLHDDVSRGKYTDATVRLPSASGLASELFVACTFRRHMKMAYMLLASQCYHREITDALECCSSLWSMSSHDDSVTLAKAAVLLQSRGRQIFGCRVPDFTLRPRTQWRPSDDILPPSLPRGEQLQSEFCPAIDAALRSYVQHFSRVFPLARIIDLDASSREVSSDTSLLKRLTCRYGKVVDPDGREATFAPHMYYALVPVSGATRLMELPDVGGFAAALPHSLFRDGLFIVEIGFQVVYFALDVFLVSGTALTNNASTQIVTRFKHMLKFSNVLYDVAAARLLHSIQMYSTHLPGQWQVSNAIANLLKHYPKPPSESLNIVVVFDMEKTFVQKMRRVLSRKRSDSTSTSDTHSIQVLPAQGEVLLREFTGEKYQYGGLVAWPSSKFFVLLSTARDAAVCQRMPNDDLCGLAKHANFLLTRLLADSMLLQYVDLAWVQFCRFEGGKFNDVEGENEDILHCLRALQSRSIKVSLHSLLGPLIQSETNWKDLLLEHYRSLSAFCSPYYVLHLLTDKAIATSSESAVGDGGGSLVLTVGGCEEGAEYLVTLEFSSDSRRFVLTKGTLHRKRNERMTGASAFSIRERELVECVTKMLSSLLWRSACFV